MPQTLEALDHAKAAQVPIVVAVNKVDKDEADPNRVRTQMVEHGIVPSEWGGDFEFVDVSAKANQNLDGAPRHDPRRRRPAGAQGRPDRARARDGARGAPRQGPRSRRHRARAEGHARGRRRPRRRDRVLPDPGDAGRERRSRPRGRSVQAGADPRVEPGAQRGRRLPRGRGRARGAPHRRGARGRTRAAELVTSRRRTARRTSCGRSSDPTWSTSSIIVKADVQGSLQALTDSLLKLPQDEVRVDIVRGAVGGITQDDVTLAMASDAIIVGFNVRPDATTRELAEKEGVDVRLYRVIYDAIDDIKAALSGLLKPEERERVARRGGGPPDVPRPAAGRDRGLVRPLGHDQAQRARAADPRRRRGVRREDRAPSGGSRTTSARYATASSAGSAWPTTRTSRTAT